MSRHHRSRKIEQQGDGTTISSSWPAIRKIGPGRAMKLEARIVGDAALQRDPAQRRTGLRRSKAAVRSRRVECTAVRQPRNYHAFSRRGARTCWCAPSTRPEETARSLVALGFAAVLEKGDVIVGPTQRSIVLEPPMSGPSVLRQQGPRRVLSRSRSAR